MSELQDKEFIHYRIDNICDRVSELETSNRDVLIDIAQIKRDIEFIKEDIREIKSMLDTKHSKNGNNKIELKRYEYLALLATLALASINSLLAILNK